MYQASRGRPSEWHSPATTSDQASAGPTTTSLLLEPTNDSSGFAPIYDFLASRTLQDAVREKLNETYNLPQLCNVRHMCDMFTSVTKINVPVGQMYMVTIKDIYGKIAATHNDEL